MTALVFHKVTEHLLNGRLNLMAGDQLTAQLVAAAGVETTIENAAYRSNILHSLHAQKRVLTPTCTLSGGVMRVTIPEIEFDTFSAGNSAFGVLFYKDTGVTSSSPLLAFDEVGPIQVGSSGFVFTYHPSTSGIVQLRAN